MRNNHDYIAFVLGNNYVRILNEHDKEIKIIKTIE